MDYLALGKYKSMSVFPNIVNFLINNKFDFIIHVLSVQFELLPPFSGHPSAFHISAQTY